jgi:hypothetical protein
MRLEGRDLPVELPDGGGDQRFPREIAGIADEIARREIVAAISDEIIARDDLERVLRRDAVIVFDYMHMRVETLQRLARAGCLGDMPTRWVE